MIFSTTGALAESSSSPGMDQSADKKVELFHQFLIEQMIAQRPYTERENDLRPIVHQTFDIHTTSRIALGLNWASISDSEKKKVQDLIRELIVSSYANRFRKFQNEEFSILSSRALGSKRYLVKTSILTKDKEVVNLDYFLTQNEDQWMIYDVTANGVSDLALKKASYGEIFTKKGLDGVLQEINKQINKNKTTD